MYMCRHTSTYTHLVRRELTYLSYNKGGTGNISEHMYAQHADMNIHKLS